MQVLLFIFIFFKDYIMPCPLSSQSHRCPCPPPQYRLGYSSVPGQFVNLPLEESTVAEELKRYGYRTALIGAWRADGVLSFVRSFERRFVIC